MYSCASFPGCFCKNQMGLKKKKIKNSQHPPPFGFFIDPEQMPDAQKMHSRSVAFYCRIRLRFFFPPLSLFDCWLRKKFSDTLETFAD